jgi:hypothetical protein
MAYFNNFNNYPAKPAFGSNIESDDAGNYIKNKTAKTSFCNALKCPQNTIGISQSNYLQLKQARYLGNFRCRPQYGNVNLNSNLYTTMNLENICVINSLATNTCPNTKINPSNIFILNYQIDPNGSLFGNTQCGINNFLQYRQNT